MSTALKQESESARALMERVLRSGAPIAPEYPLVFAPSASAAFAVHEEGGETRSACALLERELVVRERRVRAGLIGSVATDERWRGQGLAGAVLAAAEQELARRGALLAILWADDPAFYEQLGYARFGWELDLVLRPECAAKLPEPFGVRERAPADDLQIHMLYDRHPERVARTAAETGTLLACPGMEVLVLERWGRIAGYTCVGRGADMQGVVHEWAGDAQAVLALLREHLERRKERGEMGELYVIAPPSAHDLAQRLVGCGATLTQGVVGMAKIIRPDEAAELAAKLFDRRAGVKYEKREGTERFLLVGPKGKAECSAAEVFEILFAPLASRAKVEEVGALLGTPGVELPLMPFLWGLDSI